MQWFIDALTSSLHRMLQLYLKFTSHITFNASAWLYNLTNLPSIRAIHEFTISIFVQSEGVQQTQFQRDAKDQQ